MTPVCEEVLSALGHGTLSRELQEHVQTCAECAAVVESFDGLRPQQVPPPSEATAIAVRDRAFEELRKTPRAKPWWIDALWLSATSLGVAGAAIAVFGRHGWVHNRSGPIALLTVGLSLVALIGWGAYAAMVPNGRIHRWGVVLFAIEVALLVGLAGSGLGSGPLLRSGLPCLGTECAVSLLPLAVTAWFLLKAAPNPLRTLTAGLCAGASGLLALHLHCPMGTASHLLLCHVLPWIALAVLLVVIRPVLRSRTFAP